MRFVKMMIAVVLAVVMTVSLTGCFGSGNNNSGEPSTEAPAIDTYAKDFIGLQQYLIDQALVPYADLKGLRAAASEATADEAAKATEAVDPTAATEAAAATEASTTRTDVYYDLIGADDGIRFTVSGNIFVELYDFSSAKSTLAKQTLSDIKEDGKFTPIEGLDELTAVISKSGKYVAAYNAKNAYDGYEKIAKALENW